MAIKVGYIFLKTFSQVKDIPFFACSGFELNNNSPIKALGKKYFYQDGDEIKMRFLEEDEILEDFKLPQKIDLNIFSTDTLPNYQLPVVS
jgi:tRNA A37 threonylcarbamoyladenosine modification protein TsaB